MPKYSFEDIRTPRKRSRKPATTGSGVRVKHTEPEEAPRKFSPGVVRPSSYRERVMGESGSAHTARSHEEEDGPVVAGNDEDRARPAPVSTSKRQNTPPPRRPRMNDMRSGGGYNKVLWSVAAVALVGVVFVLMNMFAGAVVEATPRVQTLEINETFDAMLEGEGDGVLDFDVMILTEEGAREIQATRQEEVERAASGTIRIFNRHSDASQRLIRNTRFETPDGKIYRIRDSVVVPGTTVSEGEIVPGSVDVEVFADQPGEAYNIGLSDFSIPGFEGDPRFETFYARSVTEMTGGFVGTLRLPEEEALEAARAELRESLRATLEEKAAAQIPDGFVLYPDALFVSYAGLSDTVEETAGNSVTIRERATLQGIILHTRDLARMIAERNLEHYGGEEVVVTNPADLTLAIVDRETVTPADDRVSFVVFGNVALRWEIDQTALKDRLVGRPKEQFQHILEEFPHIERAEATIKPFWKSDFPDNRSDIEIREE